MNKLVFTWAVGGAFMGGIMVGWMTAPHPYVSPPEPQVVERVRTRTVESRDPAYDQAMSELRAERDNAQREAEQQKRRADENDVPPENLKWR